MVLSKTRNSVNDLTDSSKRMSTWRPSPRLRAGQAEREHLYSPIVESSHTLSDLPEELPCGQVVASARQDKMEHMSRCLLRADVLVIKKHFKGDVEGRSLDLDKADSVLSCSHLSTLFSAHHGFSELPGVCQKHKRRLPRGV